jgi:hypothetical protein
MSLQYSLLGQLPEDQVHSVPLPDPLDDTSLEEVAVAPAPLTPLDGALEPPEPPAPPAELKASPQPLAMATTIAAGTSAAAILERVLWFMVRLASLSRNGRDTTRSLRARGGKVSSRLAPTSFVVGVLVPSTSSRWRRPSGEAPQ